MKRAVLLLIILFPLSAWAQDQVVIRGELNSNQRLLLNDHNDWVWNENRLDLGLEKRFDKVRFYGNIWLRHLGAPALTSSQNLYSPDQINPLNLDIREAYAEVRGFLFEDLDMKVGRQRIVWGTSDMLSPTDMLNPYDLEDVFDFGRKNGSDALSLQGYFTPQWSLQGVYLPWFRPANLPLGAFSGVFSSAIALPEGLTLNEYSDKLRMPGNNLKDGASLGFRLKGFAVNTDISFSYLYGREVLPLVSRVTLTPAGMQGETNVEAELFFPRYHMLGADLAGSIGQVGVWAEAGLFFPQKEVIMTTDMSLLYSQPPGTVTSDSLLLEKAPYIRYVIGADFTFKNGIYLNAQFMHGFLHERGKENLNDYLIIGCERGIWGEKLLLRPLAGGVVISDWQKPESNYAIFYTPEIAYKGIDNLELGLGAYLFNGKGENIFAGFRDKDMLSARVKVHF
ncbi:MAG: DUF1302 family protein [Bacteroides sp.]|jgi:hypothetical protein|nr:DUF1302 family protein [Bacteroides sp.]